MERNLIHSVSQSRPEIVSLCRELCQINTANPYSGDAQPGGEAAGQELLAPILEARGAQVSLFPCPDDIYDRTAVLGPADRQFAGRPNLVAEFVFDQPGPRIIINGHMDTVGIDAMTIPPLASEVADGRIWGRGTSDCKGGITTAVVALQHMMEYRDALKGSVVFQSVVDEECNGSGAGTLACIDAGYVGDVAVFVDGNDGALVLSCSGCLTADLHVHGREGHAAYGTGVSAIEKALVVKGAIDRLKTERESLRPEARVNLGIFNGGVHPAVVPGQAYLSLNCVYEIDEAEAARDETGVFGGGLIRDEFDRMVQEAEIADEWLAENPSSVTWVKDLIPFAAGSDNAWVSGLTSAHEAVAGAQPGREHLVGWSDASYYSSLADMPTILYGPGVTGKPHSPDEYVEIDNLVRCAQVLAVFLVRALS